MLLTRITAHHFKTYLALDLDLTVQADKPLVLIGGANGGGKTTLFEAIYGALYGLKIQTERQFQEFYNSGDAARQNTETIRHITLEICFTGNMYGEEQPYILTRRYECSPNQSSQKQKNLPVEYVKMRLGTTVYAYNSAQSQRERVKHQTEIAKLIKANLPEELSRYFLFDAMESGALLREDRINTVVRENIENVMGFGKYIQFARAAEQLTKRYHAERLKVENEKQEYMRLLGEQRREEAHKITLEKELREAEEFRRKNQILYEALKTELHADSAIAKTIEQTKKEIEAIVVQQRALHGDMEAFTRGFELHVVLPKLADAFGQELALVMATKSEVEKSGKSSIKPDVLAKIIHEMTRFLVRKNYLELTDTVPQEQLEKDVLDYVLSGEASSAQADFYPFLNSEEVQALATLTRSSYSNPFHALMQEKMQVESMLQRIPALEENLEEWRKYSANKDFSLLRIFERNEATIENHEDELKRITTDLERITARLHEFDIQLENELDPKFELLQKLAPFFTEAGETLLRSKKRQIELRMMQDLNINLVSYRGVIDRVELSDSLNNINFKIFHTSGNEIFLNQLNTASKQVVVQCLLKALHEFGEYNPPVMIDTVMGALDEASRDTVLENYFPELAHQTILLSTDSEIRPTSDFLKLKPYISRSYTLQRDKDRQCTAIIDGYFGENV